MLLVATACVEVKKAAPLPIPAPVTLSPSENEFVHVGLPFLAQNCYQCHANGQTKGDVSFAGLTNAAAVLKNPDLFALAVEKVRAHEMPPPKERRPPVAAAEAAMNSIDAVLLSSQRPTWRAVRRLNKTEYVNTVCDLFHLTNFNAANDFPKDENGHGFDNITDLLTVSPLLLEQYLKAAGAAMDELQSNRVARTRLIVNGFVKEDFDNKRAYARSVLEAFAPRAWRRPVTPAEIDRLYKFVELSFAQNGEAAQSGLFLAFQAMLVSPEFLFRVELDDQTNTDGLTAMPGDYKLASRLSYFLWSTMPDAELFQMAKENKLHENDVLTAEVRRMLQDPKARALTENFAGQWLTLRNLAQASPDPAHFPDFNEELRQAMLGETERFFGAIVTEDRSIMDFIDADFTFVNGPLARLYGIPGVTGPEFQRVKLDPDQRGGVLTQASVLTVTSYADRTSPVQRGKWILENILNTPPPPPPPDVPALEQSEKKHPGASVRVLLEEHRANPACASCHQKMDPLGLAFENYDAIGRWRVTDGTSPVDASGILPGGQPFTGAKELKPILRARAADFRRCLAEKLLIYSLGRGLDYRDKQALDSICQTTAEADDHFSALILAIVKSQLFQPPTKATAYEHPDESSIITAHRP